MKRKYFSRGNNTKIKRYSKEFKLQILEEARAGKTLDEIAQQYGIKKKVVYDITRNWRAANHKYYKNTVESSVRIAINEFHRQLGELVYRNALGK